MDMNDCDMREDEDSMQDLCDSMGKARFTITDLATIKALHHEIKNMHIADDILPYFIEENNVVIQEMMEYIDLRDMEFLYDMMSMYINMNMTDRKKLCILYKIYDTILDILGEL